MRLRWSMWTCGSRRLAMKSTAKIILVTTAERFEPLVSPTSSRLYRHYSCKVLHNAEHVPQSAGRESAGRESVSYTFQSARRRDPLHFHHVMGGYLPMLFRLSHKLGHVCFFRIYAAKKLYSLISRFIMDHHVLAVKIPVWVTSCLEKNKYVDKTSMLMLQIPRIRQRFWYYLGIGMKSPIVVA